jgi:hypothetical protein
MALGPIMAAPTGVGLTALDPTEDLTAGDGRMRGARARRHSERSRRWFNESWPIGIRDRNTRLGEEVCVRPARVPEQAVDDQRGHHRAQDDHNHFRLAHRFPPVRRSVRADTAWREVAHAYGLGYGPAGLKEPMDGQRRPMALTIKMKRSFSSSLMRWPHLSDRFHRFDQPVGVHP